MQESLQSSDWREVLESLTSKEKKDTIEALGIPVKTWDRWVSRHTELPRQERLRQLCNVLPLRVRSIFIEAIQKDPKFSKYDLDRTSLPYIKNEVPPIFYSHVLEAISYGNESFVVTCQLILVAAVRQIDPANLGISIALFMCTAPAQEEGKIQSLYHQFSIGTYPWNTIIQQENFFVGAESIVGYVALSGETVIIDDIRQLTTRYSSFDADENTISLAAVPLQKNDHIGGCFLIRSTQLSFFTENRKKLLQEYSRLMKTTISHLDFYRRDQLALRNMLPLDKQKKQLSKFYGKVASSLKDTADLLTVERKVRKELEAELFDDQMDGEHVFTG